MDTYIEIPAWIKLDDRLANGRGMTSCELIGMSGGCDIDCPVLLHGECEEPHAFFEFLSEDILEMYKE